MSKIGEFKRDELGTVSYVARFPDECEIQHLEVRSKGQGDGARLVCGALREMALSCHTVWAMGIQSDELLQWSLTVGATHIELPYFFKRAKGAITYKKFFRFLFVGTETYIPQTLEQTLNPTDIFDATKPDQLASVNCLLVSYTADIETAAALMKTAHNTMPIIVWLIGDDDEHHNPPAEWHPYVSLYVGGSLNDSIEVGPTNTNAWAVTLVNDIANEIGV